MSLVFYFAPHSSATPTHWILEELGVPYESVKLDLKSGAQKKPDYLKINPNGKVPCLVHDGTPIFESAAIALYLGELFGVEKKLYPPSGLARGEAMKWIVWCNVSLGEAVSRFAHATSPWVPNEVHHEPSANFAKKNILELLQILDGALMGKNYLVGETFGIVDAHIASWLEYVRVLGIDLTVFRSLDAWAKRCLSRPAYIKVAAE
jgi:glutathione S-transferase